MQVTRAIARLLPALGLLLVTACDLPFDLGQPATRALENGAAAALQGSFEMSGGYTDAGSAVALDLEVASPTRRHFSISAPGLQLEALYLDGETLFRGRDFLAGQIGADPRAATFLAAAGSDWWAGLVHGGDALPSLPDFTTHDGLLATFLGSAVTQRSDHVAVDGQAAVELSGPRGDVFVSTAAPYRLLRVREAAQANIDGVTGADFRYTNFGRNFGVAEPSHVINFGTLANLPPFYVVVSVDGSGCAQTCVVAAEVRNLGGTTGAHAPSKVRFALTDAASGTQLGGCTATVTPDVGYNSSARVSCTIFGVTPQLANAALLTATPINPTGS